MRKLLLIAAGAGCLLALPAPTPVSAQTSVYVSPGGVSVERERHRDWRRHRAQCRTIVERHRRPNGTVVTKRIRTCR